MLKNSTGTGSRPFAAETKDLFEATVRGIRRGDKWSRGMAPTNVVLRLHRYLIPKYRTTGEDPEVAVYTITLVLLLISLTSFRSLSLAL